MRIAEKPRCLKLFSQKPLSLKSLGLKSLGLKSPGLKSLGLAAVLAATLCGPALAAPTCQDRQGVTVRCDAASAMPVGWTLPESERVAQPADEVPTARIAGAVALVACIFALIALMPPFDGRRNADWGGDSDD